jgi:hypothetical protein
MVRKIDPSDYHIRQKGNPALHQNLEWYATERDNMIGVVVFDLVDKDYSWVTLVREDGTGPYVYHQGHVSYPTQKEATTDLLYVLKYWEP